MSDNVTPPAYNTADPEKTYVLILHSLYLASSVTGITSIIGLVMAYVKYDGAEEWARGHYQYAIRTFWLGLLYASISLVLCLAVVGFLMLFGVFVWFIARSVVPIVKAIDRKPMDDPRTWWV